MHDPPPTPQNDAVAPSRHSSAMQQPAQLFGPQPAGLLSGAGDGSPEHPTTRSSARPNRHRPSVRMAFLLILTVSAPLGLLKRLRGGQRLRGAFAADSAFAGELMLAPRSRGR